MKKVLGAMLAVALTAGAANAARLGIEWNPATSADAQNATVGVGGVAQADIVVDLIAGDDSTSTAAFEFEMPTPGAGLALTGDIATALTGWGTTANAGPIGQLGSQVAAAATLPAQDSVSGPGRFVLATFDIAVNSEPAANTQFDIVMSTAGAGIVWLNASGGAPGTYDHRYAGPGASGGIDYSGYYAYGIGSPLVGGKSGQPRNPLFLTTPEPASLALLAIGGIALLRRR